MTPIRELTGDVADAMSDTRLRATQPWVHRGLVAHWPMARAGRRSAADAAAYLKGAWRGQLAGLFLGPPEINGRFFYDDTFTGMNFSREKAPFDELLDVLLKLAHEPVAP